jgi:hypothetical protein
MSTITLTLDDDFLAQAEAYAQRTGTDLSALVTNALRPIVEQPVGDSKPIPPELAALYGCISLLPGYDYKEHLAEVFNDQGDQ